MEIRLYEPPTAIEPRFIPVAVTNAAPRITRTERLYTYGEFDINIPNGARDASKFKKYLFVLIDRTFWGLVLSIEKNIDAAGDMLTVSGLCLKGLTSSRETVPPGFTHEQIGGAAGFDAITGSTEACMKHFVQNNFFQVSSPTRSIPGLVIAPNKNRGKSNDKYMTRFERLSTVLETLGRGAEIGYTMTPNLETGTVIFDCAEGIDKSATQSTNPRMVFNIERRNIGNMGYQSSDRNLRNLFYASLAGSQFADDTYTATITRDNEPLPAGIYRWEQCLDISATHPEPGRELDELKRLALARAESYTTVESMTAQILNAPQKYGVDYNLGDIVTIQNRSWGAQMHARITEMAIDASENGVTHTATFGRAPINFIDRLRRQIRGG